MKELWSKIREALISALPITCLVYIIALLPDFSLNGMELISFAIGAVLLIVGIGLFNLGADIAMTPMGTHVGAGLSRQKSLGWLFSICLLWKRISVIIFYMPFIKKWECSKRHRELCLHYPCQM
ncbi:MAG: DUF1538 family protein [Clostridia bacterium]|nr:DUF1538 family protein [Clostridia bacterium]